MDLLPFSVADSKHFFPFINTARHKEMGMPSGNKPDSYT